MHLTSFNKLDSTTFEKNIAVVLSALSLAFSKRGGPSSDDTDASDGQIGAIVFQLHQNNVQKPIARWSQSFIKAECNYWTSKKECLAVVWSLQALQLLQKKEIFTMRLDQLN